MAVICDALLFCVNFPAEGKALVTDGCGLARSQVLDVPSLLSAKAACRIVLAGGHEGDQVIGRFAAGGAGQLACVSGATFADVDAGSCCQAGHVDAAASAEGAGAVGHADPSAEAVVAGAELGEDLGLGAWRLP